MNDPVETYERNGLTVNIYQDTDPESPREWDNMGVMVCSHKRYNLGDEQFSPDDYDGWDDLKQHLIDERGAVIILPLGLYDHSGITMYIGEQHDRWDGGQVGFIFCTQKDVDGYGSTPEENMKRAEDCLRSEVNTYDQYLTGEVYGYSVINPDDGEEINSCWGFFGDIQYVKEEANSIADHFVRKQVDGQLGYEVFRELFKAFGINPYEFRKLGADKLKGYFPDIKDRTPTFNVKEFAKLLWGED